MNHWDWCEVHESRRSQPASAFCLFAVLYPSAASFCRFVLVDVVPVVSQGEGEK